MTRPGLSTCIETRTGRFFNYMAPSAEDVDVQDLARGLAYTSRFAGQTSRFYSVAEHALLVRRLVQDEHYGPMGCRATGLPFAALHHDSHEAYLGDVPSPLKPLLGEDYILLREGADKAIGKAFGIDTLLFRHALIKGADLEAMRTEARVLKASRGVGEHWGTEEEGPEAPWPLGLSPEAAEDAFLRAHEEELAARA